MRQEDNVVTQFNSFLATSWNHEPCLVYLPQPIQAAHFTANTSCPEQSECSIFRNPQFRSCLQGRLSGDPTDRRNECSPFQWLAKRVGLKVKVNFAVNFV